MKKQQKYKIKIRCTSEPPAFPLLDIEYSYTPGTPDVFYMRNGDPGYPGDPPEVDFKAIFKNFDITNILNEILVNNIIEACLKDIYSAPDTDFDYDISKEDIEKQKLKYENWKCSCRTWEVSSLKEMKYDEIQRIL